jgi:hypothetical protein
MVESVLRRPILGEMPVCAAPRRSTWSKRLLSASRGPIMRKSSILPPLSRFCPSTIDFVVGVQWVMFDSLIFGDLDSFWTGKNQSKFQRKNK